MFFNPYMICFKLRNHFDNTLDVAKSSLYVCHVTFGFWPIFFWSSRLGNYLTFTLQKIEIFSFIVNQWVRMDGYKLEKIINPLGTSSIENKVALSGWEGA